MAAARSDTGTTRPFGSSPDSAIDAARRFAACRIGA